jgi:hypothetical protein
MTVGLDAGTRWPVTEDTSTPATGDQTFTHNLNAPANVKGIAVAIACNATTAPVTGVLYAGVAMTLSATASDTSEAGRVDIYTLVGSTATIPDDDPATITLQGCVNSAKFAVAISFTATTADELEVGDTTVANTQGPDTTRAISMAPPAGRSWRAVGGMHDGNAEPPATSADYTAVSGWAKADAQAPFAGYIDYGLRSAEISCSSLPTSSSPVNIGYTTTVSEDWCFAGVAIQEKASGPATVERSAAIAASGAVASVPQRVLARSTAVAATAGVATIGTFWTTFARSTSLNATAAVAVSGVVVPGVATHERSASVAATTAVTVAGQRELLRQTALSAAAAVAVAGEIITTAQFGRPEADVAASGWTDTPLWQKLDETSADDGDFVTGVAA